MGDHHNRLARDLAFGAAAGYVASRVMDRTTAWFYTRQTVRSRQREFEANPDGTPLSVGRAVARITGRQVTDAQAVQVAQTLHRALGVSYGMLGAALARAGLPPALAGFTASALGLTLVDEGALYTMLPPPTAYPLGAHLRGVVGHATHGVINGLALAAGWRLTRR